MCSVKKLLKTISWTSEENTHLGVLFWKSCISKSANLPKNDFDKRFPVNSSELDKIFRTAIEQENTSCVRVSFLIKLQTCCNFIKKRLWQRCFSCEFCEISKNTFFTKHLWATTSKLKIKFYLSVANIASTFPPNSNSTFIVFLDRFPKAVAGRCSLKKCVLKIFAKFTGKRLCWSLVFKSYRPQTLLKTRLWHTCFPVNFA